MGDEKRREEGKESADSLRAEAQARLARFSGAESAWEGKSHEDIVYELTVHQIELEMQNEALRTAQRDLEESRDRYADLYDFAPVGYFTFKHRGVVESVNLTGASLLGVERKKLLNRGFGRFVAEEDLSRWNHHLTDVQRNSQKQTCELLLKREDASSFYARVESIRVDLSSGTPVVRSIVSDITERKRTEEEIQRLNDDLRARNEKLEFANKELESFIYSVAHDLRGPLRHIHGFADVVMKNIADKLNERDKGYLSRIHDGAEKMSRLIDDLLNLSRISRQEIQKREVNISAVAASIITALREAHPGKSVEVDIKEGLAVFADPGLIEVVLSNLIGNAWKFTRKTEHACIELGTIEQNGKIIYYVRDNGAGFNQEYAGKMFWPFHRLHSETEFEGTGIGLAIVDRIIRRHGGKVWAEGTEGKGATIYFSLN